MVPSVPPAAVLNVTDDTIVAAAVPEETAMDVGDPCGTKRSAEDDLENSTVNTRAAGQPCKKIGHDPWKQPKRPCHRPEMPRFVNSIQLQVERRGGVQQPVVQFG